LLTEKSDTKLKANEKAWAENNGNSEKWFGIERKSDEERMDELKTEKKTQKIIELQL
jgi:hypothetical protein